MDEEIRRYYELGLERDRLTQGHSRVEFERTKELLTRFLPNPPARVLDVGGGPGTYAAWLADRSYDVRLVDAMPLHVEQAAKRTRPRTRCCSSARSTTSSTAPTGSPRSDRRQRPSARRGAASELAG